MLDPFECLFVAPSLVVEVGEQGGGELRGVQVVTSARI